MKKIIIIIMTLCLGNTALFSQEKGHYLSIGGSLGAPKLNLTLPEGYSLLKPRDLGARLGYTFFFTDYVGIATGVDAHFYKIGTRIDNYNITFPNITDNEGDIYNREIILDNWQETQKVTLIEVPLLLQLQRKFGDYQRFGIFANLGAKALIPVASSYQVTGGTIEGVGHYPGLGTFTLSGLPHHGFGTDELRPSGKLNLRTGVALTAELGILLSFSRIVDMYAGAYVDYGLMDMKKDHEGSVVYRDNETDQYRSPFNANDIQSVKPFSIGGQIGLRIKLDGSKRETKEEIKARKDEEALAKKENVAQMLNGNANFNFPDKIATEIVIKFDTNFKKLEDLMLKLLEKGGEMLSNAASKRSQTPDGWGGVKGEWIKGEHNEDILKTTFDANVLFETGKSALRPQFKELLVPLILLMQEDPNIRIDIIGHTDNVGSLEYNQKLSTDRAKAVANYLILRDVAPRQIKKTIGKNFSVPVAANDTPEGRAENRRVEILIYGN